ncbi:hypothetical protein CEXT_534731 [Caerostris extrusa]|uniref:Uncharacterized protein n=1 Tax=Caerostris extrusa TaxID=172846 RepID=A0AAV4WRE1_CAEEX|nr:hypothetical protein CEXT_534731 [Caerostris extrusa]
MRIWKNNSQNLNLPPSFPQVKQELRNLNDSPYPNFPLQHTRTFHKRRSIYSDALEKKLDSEFERNKVLKFLTEELKSSKS